MMTTCVRVRYVLMTFGVATAFSLGVPAARADGNLNNVKHIIIVMQENHSYDNYFGVLGYLPNSPYHNTRRRRGCDTTDSTCVDGLTCKIPAKTGVLTCRNRNASNFKGSVRSFHQTRFCIGPDLDHSWIGSHQEGNFRRPNSLLRSSPNNGFVRVNAETEGPDQVFNHDTMGYYDDADLPFYYDIAETFAMSDRYFCDVIGQTFPNRSYLVAGTSFGHLTTSEIITAGGYKPLDGTIYDRLDAAGVSWTDYFSDLPFAVIFATSAGHNKPVAQFAADAAAGTLPAVSFIDSSALVDQMINGSLYETDEHPPADILAGQYTVAQIIMALRNSPSWNDSILFLTYDEHGGDYHHGIPPPANSNGAEQPDGLPAGAWGAACTPP